MGKKTISRSKSPQLLRDSIASCWWRVVEPSRSLYFSQPQSPNWRIFPCLLHLTIDDQGNGNYYLSNKLQSWARLQVRHHSWELGTSLSGSVTIIETIHSVTSQTLESNHDPEVSCICAISTSIPTYSRYLIWAWPWERFVSLSAV